MAKTKHSTSYPPELAPAFATNVLTVSLSIEQYQQLERAGKCKLSPALSVRLLNALNEYIWEIHYHRLTARPKSALKRKQEEIASHAERLANLLSGDSEHEQWVTHSIENFSGLRPEEIECLVGKLFAISGAARHSAGLLQEDERGRPNDPFIKPLLLKLREIMADAGQKKLGASRNPYTDQVSGPLLEFTYKALEFLAPGYSKGKRRIARLIDSLSKDGSHDPGVKKNRPAEPIKPTTC